LQTAKLTATVTSTSPAVGSFTLPEQGVWLGTVSGYFGVSNDRAIGAFVLYWYQFTSGWVLGVDQIGTSKIVNSGATVSALTVAAPSTSGVFQATLTSTRGNSGVSFLANLRQLDSNLDEYLI
jgi:hypothetical protein